MKEDFNYISYWLRRYLVEYMISIRNLSKNTQLSYRDTYRMVLSFVGKYLRKDVDLILVSDITPDIIKRFLLELESIRSCSIRTRNQRLAAVKALAKYIASQAPEYAEWCRLLYAIPLKKAERKLITYLEKNEMEAMLDAPNTKTEQGIRDRALMLFLYNTGARADEAANILIRDIYIPLRKCETPIATILGKGRKTRTCPLWQNTCKALETIIGNRDDEEHLFVNRYGEPITRHGIYDMVTRYASTLYDKYPNMRTKRVTPHTIRHTTATHLLLSGVDINTIRAWLGHVSINTTNIYAEVSIEMKSSMLDKCDMPDLKVSKKHWRDDRKLMDFLDSL